MLFRSKKVGVCAACTAEDMIGVNDVEQLRQVEEIIKRRRGEA